MKECAYAINMQLWQAALGNKPDVVESLIDHPAINLSFIPHKDYYGPHPFQIAAEAGYIEIISLFLDRFPYLSTTIIDDRMGYEKLLGHEKGKFTLLHWACKCGLIDIVARILKHSLSHLDVQARFGETPLYMASKYGHVEVLRLLLEKGANVYLRRADGLSALDISAIFNNPPIIALLLEKMGENDIETYINPAFERACSNGFTAAADLLLKKGAHPHFKNVLSLAHRNEHYSIVALLLSYGAHSDRVTLQNESLYPLLWQAMHSTDTDTIQQALINVDASILSQQDALVIFKTLQYHPDMLCVFVEHFPLLHKVFIRSDIKTMLHWAAENGYAHVIRSLLLHQGTLPFELSVLRWASHRPRNSEVKCTPKTGPHLTS